MGGNRHSAPRISWIDPIDPADAADRALWFECMASAAREVVTTRKIERLLPYLECYPTGPGNRLVAERIEDLLDALPEGSDKRSLGLRFRGIRARHLPPIARNTWSLLPAPRASLGD